MPDLFPADTDENASLADKEERPRPALGVWSRRLLNVPHLAAFLNASIRYRPLALAPPYQRHHGPDGLGARRRFGKNPSAGGRP